MQLFREMEVYLLSHDPQALRITRWLNMSLRNPIHRALLIALLEKGVDPGAPDANLDTVRVTIETALKIPGISSVELDDVPAGTQMELGV